MDKLTRAKVRIFHRLFSAYQVCGYTGLGLAMLLAILLAVKMNLSIWILIGIIVTGIVTFLSLTMLTKIITGRESLIYYHHEIAITLTTAGLLKILHQPVLPYLDITILGIGTFLFCGRSGCFMVGCCHGRPYHWGVCYGEEHRKAGFTSYLVGVRLFPVQALEALFVLFVVITGTVFVLSKSYRPGEALAWYVIVYGTARFFFEFLRGDPDRLYFLTFSEAQWTSLLLMSFAVWAEMSGVLAFHLRHATATAFVLLTMIAVFIIRRFNASDKYKLLHPDHIKEIAESIERISDNASMTCPTHSPLMKVGLKGGIFPGEYIPANICLSQTSLGIQISASKIKRGEGSVFHYALSNKNQVMREENAKALSELILKLKHPLISGEVLKGDKGVFHLLIQKPLCVPHYQGGD